MKGLLILVGFSILFACNNSSEIEDSAQQKNSLSKTSDTISDEDGPSEKVDNVEEQTVKLSFSAQEPENGSYYSLVETLRLREEPSLDGKLLGTIGYGEQVASLAEVGGEELNLKLRGVECKGRWFKVKTLSGVEGWAFAGALLSESDVIRVGPTRKFKDLETALASTKGNTIVLIDEGRYESEDEISVGGYAVKASQEEIDAGLASRDGYISFDCKNTLLIGLGKVELICTDMDANVMWVGSDDITLRNLSMRHEPKAEDREVGCTGNVVTLDIGENLTIENCELNGCGRVGLYYNTGAVKTTLRNNHIWNNSLCAIIDGNQKRLYAEDKTHDHIIFENNIIEQNGDEYKGDYEAEYELEHEEYDGH